MAMTKSRIVMAGETPYAHERAAIDHAIEVLPPSDPYHLWALVDLLEPSSGRLYEMDMLVLGYSALYLVEVKSGPGKYVGDAVDWYRMADDDKRRWMEPPLRLTNLKAKVLKSRLQSKIRDDRLIPWVQPLIFLSAPEDELDIQLRPDGRVGVVTRSQFREAIVKHQFPGRPPGWRANRITAPQIRALVQAFESVGIRARKGQAFAGQYALREVLSEGPGYQDRVAVHRGNESIRGRARIYLVPQQTSVERRQQLHRAAERESQLLYDVREHPNILTFVGYERDAPLGPTVVFDAFEGALPLDAFLRQYADLGFQDRVAIVAQVGRALAFCHSKGIVHRALSPQAVLVRRHPDTGDIETRLFNFQLAGADRVSATAHWSQLASEPWSLYQAPELREDPEAAGPTTDAFSWGALAYFVFTGSAPGQDIVEIEERLVRDGHLDARAAAPKDEGELSEAVAYTVDEATRLVAAKRSNDIVDCVEFLVESTRATGADLMPEPNPLEAGREDLIGGDLLVEAVLGHGATSRVLRVFREADNRTYALKVSLSEEHDARLRDEAAALGRLRHARVVQLIEERVIAGRQCLLLSLAGEQTLQRYLAQEGTVSLDYASRFGEDLLSALEHLEDEKVVHRDIKPANLAVGAPTKKDVRLTLFDFSLAKAATTDLGVGTSAYRDPFLRQRGRWDTAADRWSAAVTLHEMLTGVRPGLPDGVLAIDPAAEIPISAERFDSSLRGRLLDFFRQALARDAEHRFDSARAMRQAWELAFSTPSVEPQVTGEPPVPRERAPEPVELTDAVVAAIEPDTPIEALPLSARARNGLDRAGLLVASDLIALPHNRLSAVRGVGTLVAREVLEFRKRWQQLRSVSPSVDEPFHPQFRGEDLLVATTSLDEVAATALSDAGLRTLAAVAAAPRSNVRALAQRHGFDEKAVEESLVQATRQMAERTAPTSVESWLEALLPKKFKRSRYIEALFGLVEPFAGQLDVSAQDVAACIGKTRANVYLALGDARERWAKHPAISELRANVRAIIDEVGGGAALGRAGEALLRVYLADRATDPALRRARASALCRIVAEVDRDDPEGLRYLRLRTSGADRDAVWIVASEEHGHAIRALGNAADELAARDVVAPPGEAARAFEAVIADTPFAHVAASRLARLAADASVGAACSARLEIYPRGLPPARALELSSSLLKSGLSPEQIQHKVRARYPEAAPLPSRPALDTLLQAHRLEWSDAGQVYERPGEIAPTTLQTSYSSLTRLSQVSPGDELDARQIATRDFEDRLKSAIERSGLRAVGVSAHRGRDAALALAERLGVEPLIFDRALIAEMERLRLEYEVDQAAVHQADREALAQPETWRLLKDLAHRAAIQIAERVLPPPQPLLILQPGLIARYELEAFLERLAAAAEQDRSAAIFILIPSRDTGGAPRISGTMAVSSAKPLWMPDAWITAARKVA